MTLDEEESLTAKVFKYLWAELVEDGKVRAKDIETKKQLYAWYKQKFKDRGHFPQYAEIVAYMSGY